MTMQRLDLRTVLYDVVEKYIVGYLDNELLERGEFQFYDNEVSTPATNVDELIKEVEYIEPSDVFAVDGSSRTFVSSKGVVSIASVSLSSSMHPLVGVYPSISGLPSLDLSIPFIALASSFKSSGITPFLYSSEIISTTSIDGTPFSSFQNPETIEAEIRLILETEAILSSKISSGSLLIIDGPIFPPSMFLRYQVKEKLSQRRKTVLNDKNVVGIVKRLDKSQFLRSSIKDSFRRDFVAKYRVDPLSFLNDEAFLLRLYENVASKPYRPIVVGPFKKTDQVDIFVNYLIYPFHPYVKKFSVLRIETTSNDMKIVNMMSSLEFTKDGIPSILAIADSSAKAVTSGVLRVISTIMERIGVQASFSSRIGVQT